MKALMPIFVAIIGIKAMKALVLSKLAITLVLVFIIYNLVKKTGMTMPMGMMPMMPAEPMPYGAPAPATTAAPSSSYEPNWEPSQGGPYSRVWDASSAGSAHNLAYSYYPSSSSSVSSSGSSSSSSPSSSSSSSSSVSGTSY